jgi:DNA-3-methyladenine glycosylase I
LFEFLILGGAQAGLNWATILKRRENYRQAFDQFDAKKIAAYSENKIQELLANPGIIRNKLKVLSAIKNASSFLVVQQEFGSFSRYIWQFVDGKPIINKLTSHSQYPTRNAVSDRMSADLKKHNFTFVGTTICYAYMQTIGMVNDHVVDCFRYKI